MQIRVDSRNHVLDGGPDPQVGRVNCPPPILGASTRHLFGNGRVLQSTHAFRRTQPIARRREGRHFAAMRAVATTTVATCSRAFYKNTLPTRELQLFDE